MKGTTYEDGFSLEPWTWAKELLRRCHHLMSGLLANDHLLRVLRQIPRLCKKPGLNSWFRASFLSLNIYDACNTVWHKLEDNGLQPALGLMNPEVQCRIHEGSLIIPILSRINPIPRIDTYLFKVHSNIVLPKGLFPVGLPVKILKALLSSSILATCPAHLNLLDLITKYEVLHCGAFSNPHSINRL